MEEAASERRQCSAWALVRKGILGKGVSSGETSGGLRKGGWSGMAWGLGSLEEVGGVAGSGLGLPASGLPHRCRRRE